MESRNSSLTIVVPTYKRPESLLRCLHSITEQEYPPDNVLVVVQNIDYQTINILKGKKINLIMVDSPGIIHAIKSSLKLISTELTAFIDDDVTLPKDWVKKAKDAFETNLNLGALGGTDIQEGIVGTNNIRVGRMTAYGKLIGNHHLASGSSQQVDFLKGCNMVLRTWIAKDYLPLFEKLRGDGAQVGNDLILSLNSRMLHMESIFDPNFFVFHHVEQRKDSSPRDKLNIQERKNLIFNIVLIKLTFARPLMRYIVLIFQLFIGDREVPGIARSISLYKFNIKYSMQELKNLFEIIPETLRLSSIYRKPLRKKD